jgi:hypothetical protein
MFGTKWGQNRNWPTLHNTTVVLLWAALELLQVLQPAYNYQGSVACLWNGMASLQIRRQKQSGSLVRKRKAQGWRASRGMQVAPFRVATNRWVRAELRPRRMPSDGLHANLNQDVWQHPEGLDGQ